MNSLTSKELNSLNPADMLILDVRNSTSFSYGHIPGAINVKLDEIEKVIEQNKAKNKVLIYCNNGEKSAKIIKNLRKTGQKVQFLRGGYLSYIQNNIELGIKNNLNADVELSLRKKFHKSLFSKFCQALNEYELIKPHDKIAVCISGGKDSFLMAKLFQELKRHNKFDFDLVYLVMDPGYSPENRKIIELNAKLLEIPVKIVNSSIFANVANIEKSPCYICARMRRGTLYSEAKKLGCNKIALGHHFDDVIETILLGMLYGAQIQTMMPKIKSTNFKGMELIRPMYLLREADIKHWRDYNGLHFLQCACKFTEEVAEENSNSANLSSKRAKVKKLIAQLAKEDPQIAQNIFRSVENVNLSTIIEYKDKANQTHNFKDEY